MRLFFFFDSLPTLSHVEIHITMHTAGSQFKYAYGALDHVNPRSQEGLELLQALLSSTVHASALLALSDRITDPEPNRTVTRRNVTAVTHVTSHTLFFAHHCILHLQMHWCPNSRTIILKWNNSMRDSAQMRSWFQSCPTISVPSCMSCNHCGWC